MLCTREYWRIHNATERKRPVGSAGLTKRQITDWSRLNGVIIVVENESGKFEIHAKSGRCFIRTTVLRAFDLEADAERAVREIIERRNEMVNKITSGRKRKVS